MELVQELFPSPQELHAIIAHLPVALSVLGVIVVYVSAAVVAERQTLRWVAVAAYLLMAATAYFAVETGETARAQLSNRMPGYIWDEVDHHEDLAEYVWMFAVATAAFAAVSTLKYKWVRIGGISIAMLGSLATAGWVGLTGHAGGELVYTHGLGVNPETRVDWRLNPPAPVETSDASETSDDENAADGPGGGAPKATLADDGTVLIPVMPIDPEEAAKVSFTRDILPVFEEVCYECHKPEQMDGELDMTTMDGLMRGGEKAGPSIIPGEPDESPLVLYCTGELRPQMPEDDFPLTREEIHTLRMWIFAGAKDDSAEDPNHE